MDQATHHVPTCRHLYRDWHCARCRYQPLVCRHSCCRRGKSVAVGGCRMVPDVEIARQDASSVAGLNGGVERHDVGSALGCSCWGSDRRRKTSFTTDSTALNTQLNGLRRPLRPPTTMDMLRVVPEGAGSQGLAPTTGESDPGRRNPLGLGVPIGGYCRGKCNRCYLIATFDDRPPRLHFCSRAPSVVSISEG